MGTITKEFAETLLRRVRDGKHINTTVGEEEQLIRGWLYWYEHYYRPRIEAMAASTRSAELQQSAGAAFGSRDAAGEANQTKENE